MNKKFFITTFIIVVSSHIFAQYNFQFLGKKTYTGQNLSGSWGWNDTINNKEYALVGTTKGLSIVDITTPANPVEVKFINGKQGTWRECQTYKSYAYITQDNDSANSEGVLIYDLRQIPNGKADTFKGTTPNNYIARSHSLFIDEKGFLYLNGGDARVNGTRTNGVMIYDLKPNPMKPTYVGFTQNLFGTGAVNYVHDCYVRNDTMFQAHIYNTNNISRFSVWDVRNRSNPIKIQDFGTPYPAVHNMWLSDNSKTLFVTHEQFNMPIEAYDISDLNNIHQIDEFKINQTNEEIAHNVHVLNDFIYSSYYSDGVALFDASDPTNVICVGYYDTQPGVTRAYSGVWGAFGFYKSGNMTLSDMTKGLFVVKPTYIRAARIQGIVTDTNTTQELAGVKISFVDTAISILTTIDGVYKTGSVKSGITRFKAEKAGYITKFFNATLVNGVTLTKNIQLRQIPIYITQRVTLCDGITYTLPDGRNVTSAGSYTSSFILPSGKDSIITTVITLKNKSTSTLYTSFCSSTNYTLPSGKVVTTASTYSDTIPNTSGCDSIITVALTALPTSSALIIADICDGETYRLPNGGSTTTSGIFNYTFQNSFGCDSLLTVHVYEHPVFDITIEDSIYLGDVYTLPNGNTTSTQGTYINNLQSVFGCDSAITIDLKVLDTTTITDILNNINDIQLKFVLKNNTLQITSKSNITINKLIIYNSIGTIERSFLNPENILFLPDLAKGIYIIQVITNDNKAYTGKISIF